MDFNRNITRKVGIITVYENIKLFPYHRGIPFGIRFVGETVCDDKFVIKRNKSDLAAFEYIVDGTGTLEINGKVYHPAKGDMFFLAEGSEHLYYSQKENGWHKYFISFYGAVADALVKNYLDADVYLYKGVYFEKNFRRIFDIGFNTQDMEKATEQLTAELFRIFNAIYNRRIQDGEDTADKIKRYIDNNLEREFSLEELCGYFNYSKNHIINTFANKFNQTPYKYYGECKIELAKEYLSHSAMTIAEISNALSYADQQYFSYCFKKATGLTPREYRRLTITDG
mgnify:CR=1 FL=1